MALYVLPRAARSLLPYKWIRSGNRGVILAERSVISTQDGISARTHIYCPFQHCFCALALYSFDGSHSPSRFSARPLKMDHRICHERPERRLLEAS